MNMTFNKITSSSWSASSGFSGISNSIKSESEGSNLKLYLNNERVTSPLRKNCFTTCGPSNPFSMTNSRENENLNIGDRGNSLTSPTSQDGKITPNYKNSTHIITTCRIGDIRENLRKTHFFGCTERQSNENSFVPSSSTECDSSGSFLSNNSERRNSDLLKDSLTEFPKPLRLFNKSGKPLTDRMGRPLLNILGESLVIFDDRGKVISDSKGNQVFNCLGESAIYDTTNLYIPPSREEPAVPLLDINNIDILFLFDNKGHPLTDSLGRPLLCASGNPMLGMRSTSKLNINDYKGYKLKNVYGRASLEKCIRHVQIFDWERKPLTDDCGKLLEGVDIICNKNGMPICDCEGHPLYFKYGSVVSRCKRENKKIKEVEGIRKSELKLLLTSKDSLVDNGTSKLEIQFRNQGHVNNFFIGSERCISDGLIKYIDNNMTVELINSNDLVPSESTPSSLVENNNPRILKGVDKNIIKDESEKCKPNNVSNNNIPSTLNKDNSPTPPKVSESEDSTKRICETSALNININLLENKTNLDLNCKTKNNQESTDTLFLFNEMQKLENKENSLVNITHFEAVKGMQKKQKRNFPRKMYSFNIFQFFKGAFSRSNEKNGVDLYQYNEYGKPLKDIYGNALYDNYGIPLTGAQGRRISKEARRTLRLKLRNLPKYKVDFTAERIFHPLSRNESHDQFGEPAYDKYGRPMYDLAGRLIYDRFGRPLTDAFNRPLVDAIGQPLMDCEGMVLTSAYDSDSNTKLTDCFGRKMYDKRGRMLFDSYGRPKYDIFTNAIYDSCGRPATDANGKILFDFLNKPIQPFPEKPLHRNARAYLPRYIDTILAVPSMYRVLKYSQPLEDVFGGPLFDDWGRPLYNKIGKPLFDRFGRPLYDKNGTPLCDCYGRPLSEDIKQNDDDQTLSVVDCLKLLKVTEEYSKWVMSKNKRLRSKGYDNLKSSVVMQISYKKKSDKKKSGQYVYTLTRVTKFASGRQALEILEAPLSPTTVAEMHRLPVDNKPLVMVVGQRRKQMTKQQGRAERGGGAQLRHLLDRHHLGPPGTDHAGGGQKITE